MRLKPEDIKEVLREAGLKATHQRVVIDDSLIKNREHPTAEQIFKALNSSNPTLSLGTVYKTLESLEDGGLIKKIATPEGSTRYDAKMNFHHHLYCEKSQRIIDFEDDKLETLIRKYLAQKGFENFDLNSVQIQVNGEIKDSRKSVKFNQS